MHPQGKLGQHMRYLIWFCRTTECTKGQRGVNPFPETVTYRNLYCAGLVMHPTTEDKSCPWIIYSLSNLYHLDLLRRLEKTRQGKWTNIALSSFTNNCWVMFLTPNCCRLPLHLTNPKCECQWNVWPRSRVLLLEKRTSVQSTDLCFQMKKGAMWMSTNILALIKGGDNVVQADWRTILLV